MCSHMSRTACLVEARMASRIIASGFKGNWGPGSTAPDGLLQEGRRRQQLELAI